MTLLKTHSYHHELHLNLTRLKSQKELAAGQEQCMS